jgi:hypothetical protein
MVLSREEYCYSCKKFWDCKSPCKKLEGVLPKVYKKSEIITPLYNPPKKEISKIRKKAILILATEAHYSAITLSKIFNLSEKTILRYLH